MTTLIPFPSREPRARRHLHAGIALALLHAVLAACSSSSPLGEPLPHYDLPAGWQWQSVDGVTDYLTAVRLLEPQHLGETQCDCATATEVIALAGTPLGDADAAHQEIWTDYQAGKAACDHEREHDPGVGDCHLQYQELTIAGHLVYVYVGEGMVGPVSMFTFVKDGRIVHGSVTGQVDAHLAELETVIQTLAWQ